MANIKLENITKSFTDGNNTIENLNLEIENGEFAVILGPTGSGKSAVLRMIAGLDEITSGNLYIDEEISNEKLPKDRNLAMIFQNHQLLNERVYNNIAFGLKLRKMDAEEINIKVREIARILGIDNVLQRMPKNLTAHERQLVTLARALVRDPSICLFDDPFASLNDELTKRLRSELVKIQYRLKSTFLFATRDQIDAMTMANRIIVMNGGKIEQIGTPKEIYLNPQTVFVATYVGSPEINLASGSLEKTDDGVNLCFAGCKVKLSNDMAGKIDSSYVNDRKPVTVAIRPENLEIAENGDFACECVGVENHGSYKIVSLKLGEKTLNDWSVITDLDTEIQIGETLKIALDADKIHIFDQMTEENIVK